MWQFLPKLTTELSDLVLARECIGCKELGTLLCATCRYQVSGRAHIMRDLRFDGLAENLRIPLAIAYRYGPPIDAMIYRYKDNQIPELASVLSILLAGSIRQLELSVPASNQKPILIPIPSRRPSIKARGFDPLALISRHLSRAGYPIAHWLIDQRAAGRTKTLGTADRKNASHDAFRVRPIPNHYVRNPIPAIVIDDVATSGTTLTAAVSPLLLSGVHVTGCAAIAGTRKFKPSGTPHI